MNRLITQSQLRFIQQLLTREIQIKRAPRRQRKIQRIANH